MPVDIRTAAAGYRAMRKVCTATWARHIEPRLAVCKTRDEVLALKSAIHAECRGPSSDLVDLPADWEVNFIFALDRVRQARRTP